MINKQNKIIILFVLGLLLVACATYYFLSTRSTPELTTFEEVKSRVERHLVLPTDEQPALVTVTDPTKVQTEFLKNSKVGDKVLIYQKNRRAIIYRPSIDRIIDIGPVIIDTPKQGQATQ